MASFAFLLDSPSLVKCSSRDKKNWNIPIWGWVKTLVPLVNIKIAGKWMFIPLKMVLYNRFWPIPIIGWPFKISGFIYGSGLWGHGWPRLGRGPHNTTPLPRRESLGAYPRYPQWRCSRWSTQRSSQFDPAQLSLPSQPLRHRCFLDGTLW